MQSYYSVFSKDVTLGAEGMIFVILSLLLLGMQLVIANRKGYHEALAFIMTLQVLGLTRARQYPIDFDVYSVLVGYSYFELSFIPNPFSQMFPPNYVENALETLTFSFGGQNLIFNLGSIIIIFLSLQALLAIYYVAKNDRPEHVARMKLLQETIICLFMAITIYFSAIGMMSVGLNSLVGMNTNFLASICLSVVLLLAYALYFIFWVRPFRLFELYKINNIVRIIGLVVIATNRYGGIIVIDIAEILFFLIDVALYRTEKLHLKLYVAERILILIAFNASVLSPDHKTLLGIMGSTMAAVFLIKLYYTAITTKEFIDIHKLAEPS